MSGCRWVNVNNCSKSSLKMVNKYFSAQSPCLIWQGSFIFVSWLCSGLRSTSHIFIWQQTHSQLSAQVKTWIFTILSQWMKMSNSSTGSFFNICISNIPIIQDNQKCLKICKFGKHFWNRIIFKNFTEADNKKTPCRIRERDKEVSSVVDDDIFANCLILSLFEEHLILAWVWINLCFN